MGGPVPDIEALQTDREAIITRSFQVPSTIADLDKRYPTWVVDTPNSNGKISVKFASDGRAFGFVSGGAVTVVRGSVFLLPGNGGPRPESDATKATEEKLLALPVVMSDDKTEVLYQQSAGKKDPNSGQSITIYGLLGKLSLEGYHNVRLNLHTIQKNGQHEGSLDRWTIEKTLDKYWVASRSKKRKAIDSDQPPRPQPGARRPHTSTTSPTFPTSS